MTDGDTVGIDKNARTLQKLQANRILGKIDWVFQEISTKSLTKLFQNENSRAIACQNALIIER